MSRNAKHGPGKSQPVWDVLAGISGAVGQVTNITALLIPYLQDKELMGKIEDQRCFHRLATTLERDLRDMSAQFRSIHSQHSDRRGEEKNPTEVMRAIDIQEQYVEWSARFDDVVIPTFMDMLQMIQAAGGSTGGIAVPSAVNLTAAQVN